MRAAGRPIEGNQTPATDAVREELASSTEFGDALQRERPVLLAAARAITLDEPEARDLVQTTFELALRHRQSLREPGALRSWLLTIQAREAFRVVRRLRRLVRFGSITELAAAAPIDVDHLAVREALRVLPPRTRAAVVLHHMAGMPVADVAIALGVSPNTIKSQLKTGLSKLREVLGDD
jgi:RNA polymerase sigma-70 factor (ECF subfamily)